MTVVPRDETGALRIAIFWAKLGRVSVQWSAPEDLPADGGGVELDWSPPGGLLVQIHVQGDGATDLTAVQVDDGEVLVDKRLFAAGEVRLP